MYNNFNSEVKKTQAQPLIKECKPMEIYFTLD